MKKNKAHSSATKLLNNINNQKIKEIAKEYKLNYLVLFGSQADGTARAGSDFDIAYSGQDALDYKQEFYLTESLAKIFKTPKIDLVNVSDSGPLLLKEIAFNSYLIGEFGEDSFDQFQMFSYLNYIEALPLFKMQKEYLERNTE